MERAAATTIHGRYLVETPHPCAPAPLLVGFHGYAETAEDQLGRLRAAAASGPWLLVSVQALHRFYQRSTDRVVASWMTRQDRELAIADNARWVQTCLDAVAAEFPVTLDVVYAGFSQGVAMAYRAAVASKRNVAGVIAAGGDVPPELTPAELSRIPAVLSIRGTLDPLYTEAQFRIDERRLRDAAVKVQTVTTSGAHGWFTETSDAAARFLEQCRVV